MYNAPSFVEGIFLMQTWRTRIFGTRPRITALAALIFLFLLFAPRSKPHQTIADLEPTATLSPSATPQPSLEPTPLPDYRRIDVRDIAKDPNAYKGRGLTLTGEVFNIQQQDGRTILQMHVSGPVAGSTEAIVVAINIALPNVYEGTHIEVQGVGAGTLDMTNAFGATVTQPLIHADHVTVFQ